ncbi:MAG: hypothetical protein R2713_18070 [Ilumatobacteraceae bacterium]
MPPADDELPSFVSFPLTFACCSSTSSARATCGRSQPTTTPRYPTVADAVQRPGAHTLVAVGFRADGVTGAVSLGLPVPPDARIRRPAGGRRHHRRCARPLGAPAPAAMHTPRELQRSPTRATVWPTSLVRRCVAVPATPAHAIGGDWYDVFDLPDGRVVAAVGDVAGRGTEAVLTMAQASASIRALLVRDGCPSGRSSTSTSSAPSVGSSSPAPAA